MPEHGPFSVTWRKTDDWETGDCEPRWMQTVTHRITTVWDDEQGNFAFKHVKQVVRALVVDEPLTITVGTGDREWAERQAQHYGIRIEGES